MNQPKHFETLKHFLIVNLFGGEEFFLLVQQVSPGGHSE